MNQKLSLSFNAILALLVAILFYFQFKKVDNITAAKHSLSNDTSINRGADALQGKIAFINSDTLFKKYKFAIQLEADLQAKGSQMQNDLEGRGRALEAEYKNLQEKVAVMTADEARNAEERIMKKKQSIMLDEEKLTNQLATFNQNVNRQLADTIASFLKEYNATRNYDFILNYTSAAPLLLFKNEDYNVTNDVIEQLNQRWDARK